MYVAGALLEHTAPAGAEPFRWLLADPRSEGIPLVLETPQERSGIAEDDVSADPADERMMTLLRSFLPT